MEPIDPFAGTNFSATSQENRKVRNRRNEKVHFSSILDSAEGESEAENVEHHGLSDVHANLESLLDEVHEAGERVKEQPTLSALRSYRRTVRDFLTYVIRHALAVERKESGPNILKRKRFTLIKVIDARLDALAAGVLQNQRPQLDILKAIDEISGLLIDLIS